MASTQNRPTAAERRMNDGTRHLGVCSRFVCFVARPDVLRTAGVSADDRTRTGFRRGCGCRCTFHSGDRSDGTLQHRRSRGCSGRTSPTTPWSTSSACRRPAAKSTAERSASVRYGRRTLPAIWHERSEIDKVVGDTVTGRSKTWHDFTRELGVAPLEASEVVGHPRWQGRLLCLDPHRGFDSRGSKPRWPRRCPKNLPWSRWPRPPYPRSR